MAVQDDRREIELRELFGLKKEEGEGRGGNDAVLEIDGVLYLFELKSTTKPNRSVTTVRDFSRAHVDKWREKHWLFGFYDTTGVTLEYALYGSPKMMSGWIQEKAAYIDTDLFLADIVPERLTLDDMRRVCGNKDIYTLADARKIHKNQYRVIEYKAKMDVKEGRGQSKVHGYSPPRMLDILRDRARYLVLRGSTLNNPPITRRYFDTWIPIVDDHAATLRRLVLEASELRN